MEKTVKEHCDEAHDHLGRAWSALTQARCVAHDAGRYDQTGALAAAADFAITLGRLCISLPRLED